MWVVAGKLASKAAAGAAKKAAGTMAGKSGGGGQAPKKRWPLYVTIAGALAALCAIAMLMIGTVFSSIFGAIAGTTATASADCGVSRDRVSAFGGSGGSLSGVRAGSLAFPLAQGTYTISLGWGMRDGDMHNGTDFAAPEGTPIYAPADGEVTLVATDPGGYGNWIVVRHNLNGETVDTLYGHMFDDGVLVKVGDQVRGGQHIANVGNAGSSTGAHLHFSLHPGGYESYANGVDPLPWLKQDLPTSAGGTQLPVTRAPPADPATPTPVDDPFRALTADPNTELAPLPADKGTEAGAQVDSVRVMRVIAQKFPEITDIGGLRPGDPGAHGEGRAVDIMIPGFDTPKGKELGDNIVTYLQEHKDALHIDDLIWQQRYWAGGEWSDMEDRHSPTQNHYDHVHVTVAGGGTPTSSTNYGTLPGGADRGTVTLATNFGSSSADCVKPTAGGSGVGLAEGTVPEKYRAAIIAAGNVCPEIGPPVIAAQAEQESGFQEEVVSTGDGVNEGGALGFSQFMPGTWASMGVDSGLDKDGQPEPPNAPDAFNPFDAIASQGKYMCYIVDFIKPHVESGEVKGDIVDLALAGYNGGEGAVVMYGGIPPFGQTQAYVPSIREKMKKYTADLSAPQPATPGGPEINVAGTPFARAVIAAASTQQGLPYVWGGGNQTGPTTGDGATGETGFDCSGLVQYAVAQASNQRTILSRGTWDQVKEGTAVAKADIQPGDAVFSNGTGHVAIWIGDGKVIEASTFGVPLRVNPFDLNNAENIRRYG